MGDVAGLIGIVKDPTCDLESVPQVPELDEAQVKREPQARADQGDDDEGEFLSLDGDARAPDDAVQEADDAVEGLYIAPFYFSALSGGFRFSQSAGLHPAQKNPRPPLGGPAGFGHPVALALRHQPNEY